MVEAERIDVKIAAQTAEFFRDVNHAVDKGTQTLGRGFDEAGKKGSSFFGKITGAFGAVGLASLGINAVTNAVGGLTRGMLGGNAQFEQYQTSFEVLLGSSEAAKQRLDELSKFAAKTPFELPDVVQASKLLQTFGGDAIATGPVLEMVGDMASAAGVGFSEVATWVGRAYTNIQAGRPFGEAAQRLQELGLLGGEARTRLEDLSKSGASGEVVWGEFTKTMGMFNGMMVKQSTTFNGLTSTLVDNFNLLKRKVFAGLFEALKGPLQDLVNFLGSGEIVAAAEKVGVVIGNGAKVAIDAVHRLMGVFRALISESGALNVWVTKLALFFDPSAYGDPDKVLGFFRTLKTLLSTLGTQIAKVGVIAGKRLWKDFLAVWRVLSVILRPIVRLFGAFIGPLNETAQSSERLATAITLALEAWLAFLAVKQVVTLTQNIVHTGKELIKFVKDVAGTVKQTIEVIGKLIDKVQDIASKVVQTVSRAGEKLIEGGRLVREVMQNIFKPIGEKLIEAGTVVRNITQKVTVQTDEKVDLKSLGKRIGLKILEGMAQGLAPGIVGLIGLLIATTSLTLGMVAIAAGIVIAAALVAGAAFYIGYHWWNEIRDAIIVGFNTFLQGIGALGAIIVFTLFGDLRRNVLDWFDKNVEQPARRFLADLPGIVREGFEDAFKDLPDIKQRIVEWFDENIARPFRRFINELPGKAAKFFSEDLPNEIMGGLPSIRAAISSIAQAIIGLPGNLIDIKGQIETWIDTNIQQPLHEFVGKAFQLGVDIVGGLIGGIAEKLSGILQPILDEIEKGYHTMLRFLGVESPSRLFFQLGVDIVSGLINGLLSLLPTALGFFLSLPGAVISAIGDVTGTLYQKGRDLLHGLGHGALSFWNETVWPFFAGLPAKILGGVGDLGGTLWQSGRDIVGGLWDGIQSLKDWLTSKVKKFAEGIYDTIKDGLGSLWPGSPSLAGISIGKGLGDGLLKGLRDVLPSVARGLEQFTLSAPSSVQLAPAFGGQLAAANAQSSTVSTMTSSTDNSRRSVNYGKQYFISGPGRQSRDVLRDLDRMVR